MDAGAVDAGPATCSPPCAATETCGADGICVSAAADGDGDGVPTATDCDDADVSVGATAERTCSSGCGDGLERCADGVWAACDAPLSCDCAPGSAPRDLACGRCGTQRQVCADGTWTNEGGCSGEGVCNPDALGAGGGCGMCGTQERRCLVDCTWGAYTCVGEGACTAGAPQTETRSCACGADETRTRTCTSSCGWGAWSAWSGCSSCGPVCGNAMCETGESCASCSDCQNGHLGTGNNGDPCTGVPAETWRCVTRSGGDPVSQVCRGGIWVNYHLFPRDCAACVCSYTLACCQAGAAC